VVTDVGDQFRLVDSDRSGAPQQLRDTAGNGFACTFPANSARRPVFAYE